MSAQAELAKDSMLRIDKLKLLEKEYPQDKSLKILIEDEERLLDVIIKTN